MVACNVTCQELSLTILVPWDLRTEVPGVIKGHPLGRAPEVKTKGPEAYKSCLGETVALGSSRGGVWKWGSPPGARPTVSAEKAPGRKKGREEGREKGSVGGWREGRREEGKKKERRGRNLEFLKKTVLIG